MPGTFVFSGPANGEEPGAFLTRVFAEQGGGTTILLARRSVWDLSSTITFSADDQELATEGYPLSDADKAHIRTVGESAMAIAANTQRSKLRNLWIDGCEPLLGSSKGREALVMTGGPGNVGNVVDQCGASDFVAGSDVPVLQHTRGWTCCHVFDHCVGAMITNNRVGPSGLSPAWADGLSLACRDSYVANKCVAVRVLG